jgi:outer membrane protein assembly factor BamB
MLILFVCLAAVASGQEPAGTPANNWSEFTRTNFHRWNPYEKVLGVNTVPHLKLKWSFSGAPMYSSPAVLNNVVYAGDYNGNMNAWNATTGAQLWSFFTQVGSWVYSSPSVVNGVVYFSSVYPGVPGVIYAVNASTGTELWSFPTVNGSYATPTVANGVVYCGDWGGRMYALDAKTGAVR